VDVDFNCKIKKFDLGKFSKDINEWFSGNYQLKNIKTIVRKQTIKIKLLDVSKFLPELSKEVIFVSIDISNSYTKCCIIENNLISSKEFSFIVTNYDLSTLFANKIASLLQRNFFLAKNKSFHLRVEMFMIYFGCAKNHAKLHIF
jgi:hypothetical protein